LSIKEHVKIFADMKRLISSTEESLGYDIKLKESRNFLLEKKEAVNKWEEMQVDFAKRHKAASIVLDAILITTRPLGGSRLRKRPSILPTVEKHLAPSESYLMPRIEVKENLTLEPKKKVVRLSWSLHNAAADAWGARGDAGLCILSMLQKAETNPYSGRSSVVQMEGVLQDMIVIRITLSHCHAGGTAARIHGCVFHSLVCWTREKPSCAFTY